VATFVLLHGAGSDPWYWHLVAPQLRDRGHDVVIPSFPCDDDTAGLPDYVDAAVAAIGDRRDLVLVAQSLAGFVAPLVCVRVPVDVMVLVAAMVPSPGETGAAWWTNTGHAVGPDASDDPVVTFLHDVPTDIAAESAMHVRAQSGTVFDLPWPLAAWPDVPTRFLLCRDDRFFPADFQRRVVRERLGIGPDEMDGGHLPALARPRELADRLLAYAAAPQTISVRWQ
jgi:pimeloyl-ACP methyl ester carboxylesterase